MIRAKVIRDMSKNYSRPKLHDSIIYWENNYQTVGFEASVEDPNMQGKDPCFFIENSYIKYIDEKENLRSVEGDQTNKHSVAGVGAGAVFPKFDDSILVYIDGNGTQRSIDIEVIDVGVDLLSREIGSMEYGDFVNHE